jgi:hypothetical protein
MLGFAAIRSRWTEFYRKSIRIHWWYQGHNSTGTATRFRLKPGASCCNPLPGSEQKRSLVAESIVLFHLYTCHGALFPYSSSQAVWRGTLMECTPIVAYTMDANQNSLFSICSWTWWFSSNGILQFLRGVVGAAFGGSRKSNASCFDHCLLPNKTHPGPLLVAIGLFALFNQPWFVFQWPAGFTRSVTRVSSGRQQRRTTRQRWSSHLPARASSTASSWASISTVFSACSTRIVNIGPYK